MTSIPAQTVSGREPPGAVRLSLWALVQRNRQGIKLWFQAAARAHDRRQASEAAGADTMRDTGMDPETASGICTYQADLPFFMQSGFGKRQ